MKKVQYSLQFDYRVFLKHCVWTALLFLGLYLVMLSTLHAGGSVRTDKHDASGSRSTANVHSSTNTAAVTTQWFVSSGTKVGISHININKFGVFSFVEVWASRTGVTAAPDRVLLGRIDTSTNAPSGVYPLMVTSTMGVSLRNYVTSDAGATPADVTLFYEER